MNGKAPLRIGLCTILTVITMGAAWLSAGSVTSRAVQSPRISLDMVTTDDNSSSAPGGGVLSQLNLQVVGNESGNTLTMDLDDDVPNPPGTKVTVFNGTGTSDINLAESALGDGAHVEGGAACATGSA